MVAVVLEVEGREMIEGRRGLSTRGSSGWWVLTALWGSEGIWSELLEDCADGRVKDNFFMFLRDRTLWGWAKGE